MPSAALAVGPGSDQPRFVTPLPDRITSSSDFADVLVTLTRGFSGKRDEHIDTAHRFRFGRIGDQALIRASDHAAISAAYSIDHMVAIVFLSKGYDVVLERVRQPGARRVPGTSWYVQSDKLSAAVPASPHQLRAAIRNDSLPPGARTVGGLVKSQKLRPEFAMDGGYYEFNNEEYFHVEVDDDGAVVFWSSDLPADRAVTVVEDLLGRPDDSSQGFLVSVAGDGGDEPSIEVIATAKSTPNQVRMLSVGFDDCVVSWRNPQTKMRKHKVPHVEVSLSARHVRVEHLAGLMRATASPNLSTALAKGGEDLIQSLVDPGSKGQRSKR